MKFLGLFVWLLLLGVGTLSFVSASVLYINYPAPNDIISESARIRLNVSSSVNSSDCFFSYDGVRNQSVGCDGVSLVNLPNADETYRIRVTDSDGSYVDQQLTILKPAAGVVNFVYAITIIILCGLIYMIVYLIGRLVSFETDVRDTTISLCLLLAFVIIYQLNLEYISVPFILDYMDVFMSVGLWIMSVFVIVNYLVCMTYRAFKKKGLEKPGGM